MRESNRVPEERWRQSGGKEETQKKVPSSQRLSTSAIAMEGMNVSVQRCSVIEPVSCRDEKAFDNIGFTALRAASPLKSHGSFKAARACARGRSGRKNVKGGMGKSVMDGWEKKSDRLPENRCVEAFRTCTFDWPWLRQPQD